MRKLVIYHGGCMDGFCAAWAAWQSLGEAAEYVPAFHGQHPPDCTGREVYLLDFCYPPVHLGAMCEVAEHVTVLDHHKTARDAALAASARSFPRSQLTFDMDKSGARLAWEHFHPGQPVPDVVRYVEDRDLWRWMLRGSRFVNMYIRSWKHDFGEWTLNSANFAFDHAYTCGGAIAAYVEQIVSEHVARARPIVMLGHPTLSVCCTSHMSEVGEALAKATETFGATYYDRGDGYRVWSLRGHGDFDVSELAVRMGGGGHQSAAGFQEKL